ncbi:potassium voltage-gated channel subfamily A member 1-like [Clytia hemisphaerica]|uniref:potassium voltage-gated channel subfamily A member 1-like n=1 Tax=Clytia hemisphaerica TaxID=252671 RepID=UPI0034D765F3
MSPSRVTLNISGEIYETYTKTLSRFPGTLLGDNEKRNNFFCDTRQQYFFNRNRISFGAILYFYQSRGLLTCPLDISLDDFEEECLFFQLPSLSIQKMKMKRGIILDEEKELETKDCQYHVWNFLENPESSNMASVYAVFNLIMVFLSIVVACLETVEELKDFHWESIELVLNVWFLGELVLRCIFCPSKKLFLQSAMTWIDISAVVPYFLLLASSKKKINGLSFLRIIRFLKIVRLFRLSRHSKRLKIVGTILKSSIWDLQLLLLCLSILIIFGGSLMYYIEGVGHPNTHFTSIPQSLWWAVQTVTTLGYGDITPFTVAGKILAASFMLFGAVTISLPVLSIVAKFTLIYSRNMK